MFDATREKTRLWLLIFVGVVATLLGQTHAREIFAPSPHESGIFATQTQASTGENYDGIQYDALDSLLAANNAGRANTLVHNGFEVRAVRNLSHIDDSTLGAMAQKGFAPRTINGDKIVLHHHQQNPAGFIVEMPAKNHNIWNTNQHPFGNAPGVGLSAEQRTAFDAWRVDYWKTRAQTEIQRRAGP